MKTAAPALWKGEFTPSSHITCLVAAARILAAIILSLARGHIRPADEAEHS
jgi:hypothetical protein